MLQLPKKPQGGYFLEILPGGKAIWHKNGLTATGASWFLRDIFRKETALVPDNMYIGLTNVAASFDGTTLAALAAGEPVGNGYARQLITRAAGSWNVQEVNGAMQALSSIVTFTASADWTSQWIRAFLCDAAVGTVGNVIAASGPAPAARTVLNGQGPSIRYTYWLRG